MVVLLLVMLNKRMEGFKKENGETLIVYVAWEWGCSWTNVDLDM